MFHICVICMVSLKRIPLVELTKERRLLWERIISPHINIRRIKKYKLLVCSDCNQLLDTMLKFRKTMDIGVTHLLSLLKTTGLEEPKRLLNLELPKETSGLADLMLPVVHEEIVLSTETLDNVDPTKPLSTQNKVKKWPSILRQPTAKRREVHISDNTCNVDYAVLIPVNEDEITVTGLLCEGNVEYIPEVSITENAEPIPEDGEEAFVSSEETEIEQNRESFKTIKDTLQSPSSKNYDEYEPESGLEFENKTGLEIEANSGIELIEPKSGIESIEPKSGIELIESKLGSELTEPQSGIELLEPQSGIDLIEPQSGIELKEPQSGLELLEPQSGLDLLEPQSGIEFKEPQSRIELATAPELELQQWRLDFVPTLNQVPYKWGFDPMRLSGFKLTSQSESKLERSLENKSKHVSESKPECEKRKSGLELERDLVLKLKHDLGLDLDKLGDEARIGPKLALKSDLVRDLKRDLGLNLDEKSGIELEPKSGVDLEKASGLELERKLELELDGKSGLESDSTSRVEVERKSVLESDSKSGLESDTKSGLESDSKSGLESERKSGLESDTKSGLESDSKSGLESERKSGLKSDSKSGLESERKSGLKSNSKSGVELEQNSGVDSDRESYADSESTLSCESDYEDPEHFPNIIFAQAFNVANEESAQMEEAQKEKDVQQIHSHIFQNPPSEWPCTWERCQLQDTGDDEIEDLETPIDTPQNETLSRCKKNEDIPGRPKCKLCGKSFAKIYTLWQHYEREHIQPSHKCDVCRKEHRTETELILHKIKHQFKTTPSFEGASLRHACLACGVRCLGERQLLTHQSTRRHAARIMWRYQCDICSKRLQDKEQMAEHIQREHLAKEAVKCSMCSASFRSARSLQRHASAHIVESQQNTRANKQSDGQTRKRTRVETQVNRNGETEQKHEQAENPRNVVKVKALNRDTQNTDKQTSQKTRKFTQTVKAYTLDTHINEQGDTRTDIQNQALKKPRKIVHRAKTNVQTNKQYQVKRRKIAQAKARTKDIGTDVLNEHDYACREPKRQKRFPQTNVKLPIKGTDTYINQDNTHKDMQISHRTPEKTHNSKKTGQPPVSTTLRSEPVSRRARVLPTHTETSNTHHNGARNTSKDTMEHTDTQTNKSKTHGVRKRRKRGAYATRKRCTNEPKEDSGQPKGKASLFDMISSFIL